MANQFYPAGRRRFSAELLSGVIEVYLVDSALYTPDFDADANLSDIPAGARVASAVLTGKSVTGDGVFDASDTTFLAVSGAQSEYIIFVLNTGVEASSPVLAFFDTFASGMPVTPGGGNIVLTYSDGDSKIWKL